MGTDTCFRGPGANSQALDADDCDRHCDLSGDRHGLGRPRSLGVSGIVRLGAPDGGSEVTTSGS